MTKPHLGTWEVILRFTGNKSREELMIDIGMGVLFQHGCQANRHPLAEGGEKPDAMVMSRERYTAHESVSQGALLLAAKRSQYTALCCRPIPATASLWLFNGVKGLLCIPKDTAPSPNDCETWTASVSYQSIGLMIHAAV
jgi:GTP pyrophosphokinase